MYQGPDKPWQLVQAETEDVFADQLEHVILAIDAVQSRFAQRPDMRDAMQTLNSLLSTEVLNVRKQADRLRESVVTTVRVDGA